MPNYSGTQKLEFCRRIGEEWQDLADYFEVPPEKKVGFPPGSRAEACGSGSIGGNAW